MSRPDQTPLPCVQFDSMKWYLLKLEVDISRKALATLDVTFAGAFHPYFTTKGSGGIVVANGFENVGKFRDFDVAPKLAIQHSGKISVCNFMMIKDWQGIIL